MRKRLRRGALRLAIAWAPESGGNKAKLVESAKSVKGTAAWRNVTRTAAMSRATRVGIADVDRPLVLQYKP